MGFRVADFAFRAMMGAIFLGWFAYLFSLQADYEVAQDQIAAESKKKPVTTFSDESYDPMARQTDPYARVHDDAVHEERFYDDVSADSDYSGY